jgi:hypothetical protein
MKTTKHIIAGSLVIGGLLTVATPAPAQWGRELRQDRREILRERQDLNDARREYRRDLRRGADPAELARDRNAIARERRELRNDRREYWQDRRDAAEDRYAWRYDRDWGWWPWW